MKAAKIPEVAIMRLAVYLRYLLQLKKTGQKITSSKEIATITGSTSAQVRKDLAYFGEFGVRGVGYDVEGLYNAISHIIGLDRSWDIVIIGAGHLGGALVSYSGFADRGFNIKAIFDIAPAKVGNVVEGKKIQKIDSFSEYVKKNKVDMAVIVVSGDSAQKVADLVVKSGIKAILNFAPVVLNTPLDVEVRNVDVSINLETLAYYMVSKGS